MPFKTTKNHTEPDTIETLDLETAYFHPYNAVEYVRIGVIQEEAIGEKGVISLMLVQFSGDWKCKDLQASLTEIEIDLVIAGLQEAKRRMLEYKAQAMEKAT